MFVFYYIFFQFIQSKFHGLPANGLEYIINAVYFKGFDGVLIVRGCKNYREFNFHIFKYFKTQAVRQMNIKKRRVGRRIVFDPLYRIPHRFDDRKRVDAVVYLI